MILTNKVAQKLLLSLTNLFPCTEPFNGMGLYFYAFMTSACIDQCVLVSYKLSTVAHL